MIKWEYLSVVAYVADGQWRPRHVNGVEIQNWDKGQTIVEYLNSVGEEGWELVAENLDPDTVQTRWSYNWLWADSGWGNLIIDNKVYKGISGYIDYMNSMGQNGWELVSTTVETINGGWRGQWLLLFKYSTKYVALRLRFKRPKA